MLRKMINLVPKADDPVPNFPFLQLGYKENGDKHLRIHTVDHKEFNPVNGLFVAIEYQDIDGFITHRRITMNHLRMHWNLPTLVAWCHEVNEIRGFRLKFIKSFIDEGGEVLPSNKFWASIDIEPIAVARDRKNPKFFQLDSLLGAQIGILVSAARIDGKMKQNEVNAIIDYVETELEDKGILLSNDEVEHLANYVRRLRPFRNDFENAVETFIGEPPNHMQQLTSWDKENFFNAANSIIKTDCDVNEIAVQFFDFLKAHS